MKRDNKLVLCVLCASFNFSVSELVQRREEFDVFLDKNCFLFTVDSLGLLLLSVSFFSSPFFSIFLQSSLLLLSFLLADSSILTLVSISWSSMLDDSFNSSNSSSVSLSLSIDCRLTTSFSASSSFFLSSAASFPFSSVLLSLSFGFSFSFSLSLSFLEAFSLFDFC